MRLTCLAPLLLAACGAREPAPAQSAVEVGAVAPAPPQSASAEPLPAPTASAPALEPAAPEASAEPFGPVASASPPKLSPPFRVRAVLVLPAVNPTKGDPFNGDRFQLFEAPATCAEVRGPNSPPHLETMAEAVAGSLSVFSQITMQGGVVTSYRGSLTIVSVPKKPKSKGKVLLDPMTDGNVEGGELEATWCW